MKRTRRKRSAPKPADSSPDLLRQYVQKMAEQHQEEWQVELMEAAPHWVYLLGLHLRLIELENLESAVQELL